ncbi:unnamed protein product, partial [Staurois parvus]
MVRAVPGTHDRSQKPPADQSQSAIASPLMRTGHPAVMPSHPHYRSREDSARLDRGTGKIKESTAEVRAGNLSNSGTRSPPPQRSAVICTVRILWSSLCCPQSLVIPVLSAVSGHPCAVRSLWSSL